jgi:probable phosphoglycerate mutase
MTRIYIVRHAEAEGNRKHIFQGRTDADVSEKGILQLEKLRERFKNISYDKVYSSPLKRAFKTAEYANYYQKKPITCVDGLEEINAGDWEKKSYDKLPELYPEEYRNWTLEPWNFRAPNGESMRDVNNRIWSTVLTIVKENKDKTLLITSHGCVIRNFICRAMGLPLEKMRDVSWIENTAISTVEFDSDFASHVVKFNDYSHLDKETQTLGKSTWWKNSISENAVKAE